MLIIIGLITLNSCSSDRSESGIETIDNLEVQGGSDVEQSSELIDTISILKWNDVRKSKRTVTNLFRNAGNKFSFKKDSITPDSIIHAYVGWNGEQLSFTLIKATDDTFDNKTCMLSSNLGSTKHELPAIKTIHRNYIDSIAREEARNRINYWMDENKRKDWINQQFNSKENLQNIFLVFRINTADFEYGVMHDCYLSLREDTIDKTPVYVADLITVNRATNKIGPISNGNVEDVTQPIPPLGVHDQEDYGLWQKINQQ